LLLLVSIASVFFGSAGLSAADVLAGLRGIRAGLSATLPVAQIVLLRLLRIGLGVLVGASLGLSGFLLQTAFRNPLADSYLLGVSGGAQLAVTIVALLGVPATADHPGDDNGPSAGLSCRSCALVDHQSSHRA